MRKEKETLLLEGISELLNILLKKKLEDSLEGGFEW